jgi:2-keto-4-pentenoate hydratase
VDAHGAFDPVAAARALRQARQAGRTLDTLLSDSLSFSLDDAYRVQDQVTALRLAGGERRAGWKLGYTSAVMRAQMAIDAPNFGPLTDVMLLDSPALLAGIALQPRVEPEIGLRLGRRLTAPCSVDQALDACDGALACLEIVDSVWAGYRFTLEDNTADGSSAAGSRWDHRCRWRTWHCFPWRCRWTARRWSARRARPRAAIRPPGWPG